MGHFWGLGILGFEGFWDLGYFGIWGGKWDLGFFGIWDFLGLGDFLFGIFLGDLQVLILGFFEDLGFWFFGDLGIFIGNCVFLGFGFFGIWGLFGEFFFWGVREAEKICKNFGIFGKSGSQEIPKAQQVLKTQKFVGFLKF